MVVSKKDNEQRVVQPDNYTAVLGDQMPLNESLVSTKLVPKQEFDDKLVALVSYLVHHGVQYSDEKVSSRFGWKSSSQDIADIILFGMLFDGSHYEDSSLPYSHQIEKPRKRDELMEFFAVSHGLLSTLNIYNRDFDHVSDIEEASLRIGLEISGRVAEFMGYASSKDSSPEKVLGKMQGRKKNYPVIDIGIYASVRHYLAAESIMRNFPEIKPWIDDLHERNDLELLLGTIVLQRQIKKLIDDRTFLGRILKKKIPLGKNVSFGALANYAGFVYLLDAMERFGSIEEVKNIKSKLVPEQAAVENISDLVERETGRAVDHNVSGNLPAKLQPDMVLAAYFSKIPKRYDPSEIDRVIGEDTTREQMHDLWLVRYFVDENHHQALQDFHYTTSSGDGYLERKEMLRKFALKGAASRLQIYQPYEADKSLEDMAGTIALGLNKKIVERFILPTTGRWKNVKRDLVKRNLEEELYLEPVDLDSKANVIDMVLAERTLFYFPEINPALHACLRYEGDLQFLIGTYAYRDLVKGEKEKERLTIMLDNLESISGRVSMKELFIYATSLYFSDLKNRFADIIAGDKK